MKAAPGGQLGVKDIFGRDTYIAELWNILDTNSLRLEAERRIGKTSILKKMEAEPAPGWEAILLDLENTHSADEFAQRVCEKVHERLTGWRKQGARLQNLFDLLGGRGFEIAGTELKFPESRQRPEGYWKTLLTSSIEDLVEQQASADKRVVFLFDEMPWMLTAIAEQKPDGPQTAMKLLDELRALRQSTTTGPGFRMVVCGSIGMHHILGKLKKAGYGNQPVNDVHLAEVPPLDMPLAVELVGHLLAGEGLSADPGVPQKIAEETGAFPYYIHWVISKARLKKRPATITHRDVDETIDNLLTDPHDPCNFRHFKDRIHQYYPNQVKVACALIDHAACSSTPLKKADFFNPGMTAGATEVEQVRELLKLLAMDHYLAINSEGNFHFRHELIRRWWKIEQGLN